ncbi:MAG: hypothetical protein V8Q27_09365 [Eubacteriales bacterium]
MVQKTCVIPGGISVGIYMETDGVLVIGTGKVTGRDGLTYEPAFGWCRPAITSLCQRTDDPGEGGAY